MCRIWSRFVYIISSLTHAFWLVLTYDLLENRRIDDDSDWFEFDSCVILWTNHNSLLSIATNQFAPFYIHDRLRQSAIFVSVKVAKFKIKRLFSVYFNSLLCKIKRFHVAVRLFSNRSQMTQKCGKNISDTIGCAPCATFFFLPHFNVICDLLLNRRTATWNLFVHSFLTCGHNVVNNFLVQGLTGQRKGVRSKP